jgi:alpha-beta hydrolase superfamily lysophospholipase
MANMRVLELRIHGIANSPPADMLCTTNEEIERKDGDEQGSFWRIRPKASAPAAVSRRSPAGEVETLVEAYSWGNQARTGGSAIALVGRAIVHVGWLFVLPFGLCNLAYWARRDIKGTDEDPKWWAGGDGAVAIRVFALLQTLFYTVGFLTVFVHLMGLQCFRAVTVGRDTIYQTCAALPSWLDFLAGWTPIARAALFSIAPIAVTLLIYVISLRARGMFNPQSSFDDDSKRSTAPDEPDDARAGEADPPRPALLSSAGFWHRSRVGQTSERAHFAAAIALILLLLAADALIDSVPGRGLATVPGADLIDVILGRVNTVGAGPVPFLTLAVSAALLVGAVVITAAAGLSGKSWSTRSKRGWSTTILVLSAAAYVAWIAWALLVARASAAEQLAGGSSLRGLTVTPTVIAAGGALIAVASLTWGYRWRRRTVMWVVLPLALASGVASALWGLAPAELSGLRSVLAWCTVGLVGLAILIGYLPFADPRVKEARRQTGWHGNGAAVVLLLALLASLIITSLFVLGTHAWLTADTDLPVVKDSWRIIDPPASDSIETPRPIGAPTFHERFSGMLVVGLAVFLGSVLLTVGAALRRFPAFSLPGPDYDQTLGGTRKLVGDRDDVPPPPAPVAGKRPPVVVREKDYPPSERRPSGRLRVVADARRVAGLLHRGEPILRVLAILTAVALVPLALPFLGETLEEAPFWGTLLAGSRWAIGLIALAAVGWVVTNAVTSTERPLALVWDIICFFPRAGHPFAPPCYAERAVPEVTKRIRRWMGPGEAGEDGQVILSAHSMGATIAVGAILAMHGNEEDDILRRVALLTHGVQLRPYFSRFFPEVFGPRVLGVRGTLGPRMFDSDPWRRQVIADNTAPALPVHVDRDPPSVVELLGGNLSDPDNPVVPRWRSLWRRTDYLGFPITGFWSSETNGVNENPIDRGATERSPRSYLFTVARHNDYLSTPQYRKARNELVGMLAQGHVNRTPLTQEPPGSRLLALWSRWFGEDPPAGSR